MTNDVENFLCAFCHYLLFCLNSGFFLEVVCIFLLSYEFFYILDANPLSDMCIWNIFFHSYVSHLSVLVIMPFHGQDLKIEA